VKILALDPATNCGWAIGEICGTWDLSPRRDESKGMRLIRLRGKLNEILSNEGVDMVAFEAARHGNPKMMGAVIVQAELQGVVKVWCEDNQIEYRGYSPSEIKKHATGKGNANKEMMILAAKQKWTKLHIPDDNAADAMWILDLARTTLGLNNGTQENDKTQSTKARQQRLL
jgi:Holliday junction resolvasome RuvABC endonuclease subunit